MCGGRSRYFGKMAHLQTYLRDSSTIPRLEGVCQEDQRSPWLGTAPQQALPGRAAYVLSDTVAGAAGSQLARRQGGWGWEGTGGSSTSAPTGSMARLAQPTGLWEPGTAAKGSRDLARARGCLARAPSQGAWVLCPAPLLAPASRWATRSCLAPRTLASWSRFWGPGAVSLITACTRGLWMGHAVSSGHLTGGQWTVCSRLYTGSLMVSRWSWRCWLWPITS